MLVLHAILLNGRALFTSLFSYLAVDETLPLLRGVAEGAGREDDEEEDEDETCGRRFRLAAVETMDRLFFLTILLPLCTPGGGKAPDPPILTVEEGAGPGPTRPEGVGKPWALGREDETAGARALGA